MKKIVMSLIVVNNTAARSIADVTKYANSANDGGKRAKTVAVVDYHESLAPSSEKNVMANA